jgi:hypothetical protein
VDMFNQVEKNFVCSFTNIEPDALVFPLAEYVLCVYLLQTLPTDIVNIAIRNDIIEIYQQNPLIKTHRTGNYIVVDTNNIDMWPTTNRSCLQVAGNSPTKASHMVFAP